MKKPVKKKLIKTRDLNMVKVINGATKAAVHIDRKKEADKKSSRRKVEPETACMQCGFPIDGFEDINLSPDELFCSWTCFEYYTEGP